jgi:hypothetical protein
MDVQAQRWCAASGLVCVAVFLVGFFIIAGFVPPPSPSATAGELQALFHGDTLAVRVGLVLAVVAAAFIPPWVCAVAAEMRRIDGPGSPLVMTQLSTGTLLFPLFAFPPIMWQSIAYRDDIEPSAMVLMNDLAWLMFVAITWTAVLQAFAVGAVILRNHDKPTVFPRWMGYFNVWVGIAFIPGTLAPVVKSGPLAWNGVFTWWVPVVTFVIWTLLMSGLMIRNKPAAPSGGRAEAVDADERVLA